MDRDDPIFVEYKQAADAVRRGDDSPAAQARHDHAEYIYRAALEKERATKPNSKIRSWYDLPVARACWEGDAKCLNQ